MKFEYLQIALGSLLSNKTRSFLSMLGIIIGVSTVIIVIGIGLGAQQKIKDQYKNMSVESIIVRAGGNTRGAGRVVSKLKKDDVDYVLQNAEDVRDGMTIAQGDATVAFGKDSASYTVFGIEQKFFGITNLKLKAGNDFTADQYISEDKVVIIGDTILTTYFDSDTTKAIGQIVTIANKDYEIIGVLEKNGVSSRLGSYDEGMYVPYDTATKKIFGTKTRINMTFLAKNIDVISNAMD